MEYIRKSSVDDDHFLGLHSSFCSKGQSGQSLKRKTQNGGYEIFGIHMGYTEHPDLDNQKFFTAVMISEPIKSFIEDKIDLMMEQSFEPHLSAGTLQARRMGNLFNTNISKNESKAIYKKAPSKII